MLKKYAGSQAQNFECILLIYFQRTLIDRKKKEQKTIRECYNEVYSYVGISLQDHIVLQKFHFGILGRGLVK